MGEQCKADVKKEEEQQKQHEDEVDALAAGEEHCPNHHQRRPRSPSSTSLPGHWKSSRGATRGTVVVADSVASLIGSDSALVVRDKPPLPRRTRRRKTVPAPGLDADDEQPGDDDVDLQRTKSSKSFLNSALNFFRR